MCEFVSYADEGIFEDDLLYEEDITVKDSEEIFIFSQNALANAQTLLDDDGDEINTEWSEFELEGRGSDPISNTQGELDEEIGNVVTNPKLIPRVVVDIIQGEIRRCNSTDDLRSLGQMIGTWEVDVDAAKDVENKHRLGVCYTHFLFDQNQLHDKNAKQSRSIEKSAVHFRICIFCNKMKCFFSRGTCCKEHSWSISERNIQIPCIGVFKCPALTEGSIASKAHQEI